MSHKHFSHPADGRKLRVGACRKDRHDSSHTHYEATAWEPDALPPYVDLRAHLTDVEDQGEVGSCTANALAGALEYLEKRRTGREVNVSRLFIYWNERDYEGSTEEDHGAALADGIKVLKNDGTCSEETWEYSPDLVFEKPHDEAYSEASNYTIDEAHRVKIDLHDMRHCLAEGYPFVFGLQLYDHFQEDGAHGRIRVPNPRAHELAGGHAMLAVGYSDKDECFLVRNSWGPDWGHAGYCYIPYEYMTNPDYCHDAWTIRKAHELDFTEGVHGSSGDSFFEDNEDHEVTLSDDSPDDSDDPGSDDSGSDDSGSSDDSDDSGSDDSASDDSGSTSDSDDADADKTAEELEAEIEELDAEIAKLDEELKELDEEENG